MMATGRTGWAFSMCFAIFVGSAILGFSQNIFRGKELNELAKAERDFAAFTVKEGFREGFSTFFADDGIGFGPHPERTREKLLKSPAPNRPRTVIFNWAPMFGDISLAGDLGYTTGPVLYTDITASPKPPWHGMYFSIWQKQADGNWKVAIDMGVETPEAVAPIDVKFTAAEPIAGPATKFVSAAKDYRQLDWDFWGSIAKMGPSKAYNSWLGKQFRIHRKGAMPITDRKNLTPPAIAQTKFEFIDGKIASSGDLAFTYGKYAKVNDPNGEETGYYVHVWMRNESGKWKLVADVANPLSKT